MICEGLKNDWSPRGESIRTRSAISAYGGVIWACSASRCRTTTAALAAELGIQGAETIGFIGSFYDYEGLDVLIERNAGAGRARGRQMHLVLVGGGPCDAALTAQAAASPVADRIHFVGRRAAPAGRALLRA